MPNQTPNLNLTKPLQTEYYNIDVHNANSDIIDTAIASINTDKSDKLTAGSGIILTSDTVNKRINIAVDPVLPAPSLVNKLTINGKDFNGSTAVNIIIGDELGSIKPWLAKAAPAGWLALDTGALVSRNTYADLWAWVQANAPLLSETDWQAQAATQTSVGAYSMGDGSTTFRLPRILDYMRGGLTADVGKWQADAFQGHKFNLASTLGVFTDQVYGTGDTLAGRNITTGSDNTNKAILTTNPVSDGTNGTPRTANETRPKTIKVLYCVKAVNYILK